MRLPLIFTAFFLGLVAGSCVRDTGHAVTLHVLMAVSTLGFILLRRSSRAILITGCAVAFIAGNIWIACLPSWPVPLSFHETTVDGGCTIVGCAAGEAFECPAGRFIPISLEMARAEGFGSEGRAIQGSWQAERGIALVRIRRDFVGVYGSRYRVHGRLAANSASLRDPILLRYRARARIDSGAQEVLIEQIADPDTLSGASSRLRYLLMSHLSWGLGEQQGELVAGVTFGRRGRRLGGEWAGDFYRAGISHLIVASGAQVSLLFLPLFFLLGQVRLPIVLRCTLLGCLGAVLIGFARLLGGEPSILRAAAMGCILLIALGMGRRVFGLATLSGAGIFWLLKNPLLAQDSGFLLSFGASFGIIYLGPVLIARLSPGTSIPAPRLTVFTLTSFANWVVYFARKLLGILTEWTIVTIAAQIGVFPILACTIGRVSLAGFIANLFAVPIAQVILYLGAMSGIGGFISPAISLILNRILGLLAQALMTLAHDFANIPYANMPIDPLPAWVGILWYVICLILVERSGIRRAVPVKRVRPMVQNRNHNPGITHLDPDKPLPAELNR